MRAMDHSAICLTIIFRKKLCQILDAGMVNHVRLFLLAARQSLFSSRRTRDGWSPPTLAVAGAVSNLVILALGHEELRKSGCVFHAWFRYYNWNHIHCCTDIFGRYNLSQGAFLTRCLSISIIRVGFTLDSETDQRKDLSLASRAYSMPDSYSTISIWTGGQKYSVFYIFFLSGGLCYLPEISLTNRLLARSHSFFKKDR